MLLTKHNVPKPLKHKFKLIVTPKIKTLNACLNIMIKIDYQEEGCGQSAQTLCDKPKESEIVLSRLL